MPDIFVAPELEDYIILIDMGHGGMIDGEYVTPGKRSPVWDDSSQYFEGVGNREIGKKVLTHLHSWNIKARLLLDTEEDTPIVTRVNLVNDITRKYKKKRVLLVSIHSDAFDEESAHGWSVYTSPGDTGLSDKAATIAYLSMVDQFPGEKFRVDMSDGDADKEARFAMINKTICPSVLIENFFMTNKRECQEILMTEEGQDKIAIGIALFINKYVKKHL